MTVYVMGVMAKTKRVRLVRSVTLNPEGVEQLIRVGKSRPVPETNLSRLIDDAIAEYVEQHGGRKKRRPTVSPRDSMLEPRGERTG